MSQWGYTYTTEASSVTTGSTIYYTYYPNLSLALQMLQVKLTPEDAEILIEFIDVLRVAKEKKISLHKVMKEIKEKTDSFLEDIIESKTQE